ncbi:uncharacterized protein At2g29880 isoform X2 [Gossypium hirsutum]|uniref:Uncharacterized protein At2g29880 isoform X2 n=1 Tax=Gossypium hirsutum TaxID=3635 RepID=A0A1U8IIP9_GOSHI|nr:uncharacterized protein At2g29880 isoform X2 [Gossypium hirsutum]XP_040940618.1 uncharacterized protein At2g29880 isoform X2 [Gossypium hirsutum]XP_040940619.1 uncharacterized protein At2g29880 isoform X2 [Gossypium hirsutum]XP_040940620.1 uncharacterized protein At2g29880 isoform X2 [Gossypium hirsutum]XP_040940622.1 uncharacterized protein At2g29880 isoform X2 [Gossypium hirsutum]
MLDCDINFDYLIAREKYSETSRTCCYCFIFLFGLFDRFLHPDLSILYSRNHFMSGFSQSSVSSQSSRGTKRKWVPKEYAALLACMVDLHNPGTFNADTRFKAGSLNELEKMLEKVLPNAMLKAKPNLESRIRTLKRDWSIVYDMLSGKNNSGFGWDEHRQLVVVEDAVWNSYINSHNEAAQFRHRSFPYYNQLIAIYAKDRATRKDAQRAADIIEEINAEDVAATNTHEERNDFHGSEADVSLDDMDLSATQPQPEPQPAKNQGDSAFSKKKKKISDASDFSTSFNDAAALLVESIRTVGLKISKSILRSGNSTKVRNDHSRKCSEIISNIM